MTRAQIQILPADIAEKIAAGEVIERPASVIKELIENSIDADASRIVVEIEDGGKKKIRVSDDGFGIRETELHTALQRHATSKIRAVEDLWNLSSMGFRGEALPSIATIARFAIESRTTEDAGKRLYFEGGKFIREEPPTRLLDHSGTSVQVDDLFFNVPARLKFQRSKTGESTLIREMLEHFALTHPHISFTLISEGRKTFDILASDEMKRVATIFDTETSELEPFESHFEGISIRGLLDRNARMHNSKSVFIAANNRIVKDKLLQQAVIMALRPRMMEGEYPRLFLRVDVPPQDIDVNVHPTKTEVRFRRSRDVFQVIHGALQKLASEATQAFYKSSMPSSTKPLSSRTEDFQLTDKVLTSNIHYSKKHYFENNTSSEPNNTVAQTRPESQQFTEVLTSATFSESRNPPSEASPLFSAHYIGQLKNTYLLFQNDEGLVFVDQHAAHERIQYEKIKKDFIENGLKPQPLLIALTIKLKAEELELALEHRKLFENLGFEIELFGEQSLIVRTTPEFLKDRQAFDLFKSLLTELKNTHENDFVNVDATRLSPKVERVLSTMACHSSVRAGQTLSEQEAHALFSQMETTPSSLNCPHGRPASIHLDFNQIEHLFKR